ncbi:hypothetical protein CAPTEDRAFT_212546 [Capitella teleta]|uniref:Retrotransposon gag domain-containing protein n=1 Tax=Capitella teleta TaxID=283909 RepID=R7TJB1_CAPTE|nr:hypothetical protein CAPTEDRAFT_212546 [Capitella teleta]|eukprot:ELT91636.1 hypothetical protein CAPTEDRAFT_212546 [Capitella teleta]
MTNQQRQYRPSLDWRPDTNLPQRFARWKEGDEKSPKYICNFIKVCSGDHTLTEFYKQARDLVHAMNMDKDPLDKSLRCVFLNGLSSKEIYKECLKVNVDKLTSKAVMDIASNIQARNLMAEDLSMMAQQVLPENALTRGFPSQSSTAINRIRPQNHHPRASIQQKGCGWWLACWRPKVHFANHLSYLLPASTINVYVCLRSTFITSLIYRDMQFAGILPVNMIFLQIAITMSMWRPKLCHKIVETMAPYTTVLTCEAANPHANTTAQ